MTTRNLKSFFYFYFFQDPWSRVPKNLELTPKTKYENPNELRSPCGIIFTPTYMRLGESSDLSYTSAPLNYTTQKAVR